MKRRTVLFIGFLLVAWVLPAASYADKSSVTIEAPDTAEKGTEIPVKIHVKHHGNNFMHYTKSAEVKVNGETVETWEFSAFKRPEEETFTREVMVTVDEPVEITAEASCNIHGSEGPAAKSVKPAE
jgi:desulfoferrodoxin (superoxide reductase-like protein)